MERDRTRTNPSPMAALGGPVAARDGVVVGQPIRD